MAYKQLRSLLISCSVLFLALFAFELFLRFSPFSGEFSKPYELHQTRGWALRKNHTFRFTKEGSADVRTNSHGFRGREWSEEKAVDTYRVFLLGDSFVEAKQVAYRDSIAAHLESKLSTCPPLKTKKIEVLNFGTEGYGTTQEYLALQEFASYSPDFVLLGFFAANDYLNNVRQLNPSNPELAPYFLQKDDGDYFELPNQRENFSWRKRINDWSLRSRLVDLLWASYRRFFESESVKTTKALKKQLGVDYQEWLSFRPEASADMEEALRLTQHLLAKVDEKAKEIGAPFLLFSASMAVQVHYDKRLQRTFKKKFRVTDLFAPEKRLAKMAEQGSYGYLPLAPKMYERAVAEGKLLHGFLGNNLGFGHWNERGHEIAAELVSEKICESLSLSPGEVGEDK